jgi:hypothetical protein
LERRAPLRSPADIVPLICHRIPAVSRGFLGAAASGLEIRESAHDPVRRLCSLTLLKSAV